MEANLRGVVQFSEDLPSHLHISAAVARGEKSQRRRRQQETIATKISHTYDSSEFEKLSNGI